MATTKRFDPYSFVHKMQRARLFSLVVEAGQLDESDARAVEALAGAVRALIRELRNHAHHEDSFIHPLLRDRVPAIAAQLEAEHVELDAQMDELERVAGSPEIYRRLASFTASYLVHLEREEGVALPGLWQTHSDEELAQIMVGFRGSRSEVENLTSALSQLPTLSPPERQRFLAIVLGARQAEVSELLASLLSPAQLGLLGD